MNHMLSVVCKPGAPREAQQAADSSQQSPEGACEPPCFPRAADAVRGWVSSVSQAGQPSCRWRSAPCMHCARLVKQPPIADRRANQRQQPQRVCGAEKGNGCIAALQKSRCPSPTGARLILLIRAVYTAAVQQSHRYSSSHPSSVMAFVQKLRRSPSLSRSFS